MEMKTRAREILIIFVLIIIGLYFTITGLVAAKGFLAPLSIAILLAMILTPLSGKMEMKGISRGWASFVSVLITMLFFAALFFVVSYQIKSITDDWPKIKKTLEPKVTQLQNFIESNTGISTEKQKEMVSRNIPSGPGGGESGQNSPENDNNQNEIRGSGSAGENKTSDKEGQATKTSGGSEMFGMVGSVIIKFFSFLGTFLLMFVYMFFLLLYRHKLKLSILKFFPKEKQSDTRVVLNESINVSQKYLVGRLLLIFFLIIIYSVGLLISGVKYAILISIIAAVLSLLPYVGNILGFFLAIMMAAFSGGQTMMLVGTTITFTIAQFVESYILEPYVVGKKVELNPLITILVVALSGAVWGVIGMIISIPVFGIMKIIFDHIPVLKPLGYALGEEDIASAEEDNFMEKWVKKAKEKITGKKNE